MNAEKDAGGGPVIVLSYLHAGGQQIQEALAAGTDLACTAGTGILPQCAAAAAAWAQVDDRPGGTMSQLALASIRTLVNAQLTSILTSSGKRRWCELAVPEPAAAQTFLRIVPRARFVCVHRVCKGVISDAIAAQPWGLTSPPMARFTMRFPGNSVAAAATYWAWATEQLLTFEAANPQCTSRVRFEDVQADEHCLDGLRSALCLQRNGQHLPPLLPEPVNDSQPGDRPPVPDSMIPQELRERIDGLQTRLGYPLPVLAAARR